MATQKYMYLNNGTKVPVYGNADTHSMPYRTYVTETVPEKAESRAVKTKAAADNSAAKLAAERRRSEKIASINTNRDREMKRMGENAAALKDAARQNNNDNLRQLYIAYMQGLQGIPQKTAMWGAGGEIESLKNQSRLNYETNRAKENRNYAGVLGDIQQKYNDDLQELERRYLQQLLNV